MATKNGQEKICFRLSRTYTHSHTSVHLAFFISHCRLVSKYLLRTIALIQSYTCTHAHSVYYYVHPLRNKFMSHGEMLKVYPRAILCTVFRFFDNLASGFAMNMFALFSFISPSLLLGSSFCMRVCRYSFFLLVE